MPTEVQTAMGKQKNSIICEAHTHKRNLCYTSWLSLSCKTSHHMCSNHKLCYSCRWLACTAGTGPCQRPTTTICTTCEPLLRPTECFVCACPCFVLDFRPGWLQSPCGSQWSAGLPMMMSSRCWGAAQWTQTMAPGQWILATALFTSQGNHCPGPHPEQMDRCLHWPHDQTQCLHLPRRLRLGPQPL